MTCEEVRQLVPGDRLIWMGEGSCGGWVLDNHDGMVWIGWDGGYQIHTPRDMDGQPSAEYWRQVTRGEEEDCQ